MNALKLSPIYISAILLSAHCLRLGYYPLVAISLLFPFLLFIKQKWAARTVQLILILGCIEWLRTLFVLVQERISLGEPWVRLVIIIGSVALFTVGTTFVFQFKTIKKTYRLN